MRRRKWLIVVAKWLGWLATLSILALWVFTSTGSVISHSRYLGPAPWKGFSQFRITELYEGALHVSRVYSTGWAGWHMARRIGPPNYPPQNFPTQLANGDYVIPNWCVLAVFLSPTMLLTALDRRQRRPPPKELGELSTQERFSRGTALAACGAILVIGSLLMPIAIAFVDAIFQLSNGDPIGSMKQRYAVPEWLTAACIIFLCLLIPCVAARLLYACIRWRRVFIPINYCLHCHYNLTANQSGKCPECGTPTPASVTTSPGGATDCSRG